MPNVKFDSNESKNQKSKSFQVRLSGFELINKSVNSLNKWQIKNKRWTIYPQDGFMAVATVILISIVVLTIASTVALGGIGESQSSFAIHTGETNLALVEGCAEDAMLKARLNSTFGNPVGTPVNITRPEGTCVITVLSKVGSNPITWTMNITTTDTSNQRKIQVIFTRSSSGIELTSWKEI